ncbi:hypothetical protein [Streptomyces massasporeus]
MNRLSVEQVPDPELRNDQDVIVRLIAGITCGSDLHPSAATSRRCAPVT